MSNKISDEQFAKQAEIIRGIEQVFFNAARETQRLISETGWNYNDIRVSLFGKFTAILNSALVSLYFLQNHLTHDVWWRETFTSNYDVFAQNIRQTIDSFENQTKTSLLLGITANSESTFRVIVRALDPSACNSGYAPFAIIYDWILNKTNNRSDKSIYDMLRHLRNSKLHSDGVFSPPNGNNEYVEYRQTFYTFLANKPISGFNWDLLTNLAHDNLYSMLNIVKSPEIRDLTVINDPQKL